MFKAKQLHQEDPIDSAVVGEDDDNNLNESLPGLDEICQELLLEDGCVQLSFFLLFLCWKSICIDQRTLFSQLNFMLFEEGLLVRDFFRGHIRADG